jgi:uncharacterized protein YgbK (DUF1537 family)
MNVNYNDILPLINASESSIQIDAIISELKNTNKIIIVLDDDPTGTQTVHNVPVLTIWSVDAIINELNKGTFCFYILTNSRSLTAALADELHKEIANNIQKAFALLQKEYIIISRSDSTLRGHYPNDIHSLASGLEISNYHTVIIPAFFEGGRFTINDIHYVKENELLIPAANTAFAKDKAFGFAQSNLKKWVQEKTQNLINASSVVSFSLDEIRSNSLAYLTNKINLLPSNSTVIVNALNYTDLKKFAAAYLQSSVQIMFRTAASFVKALAGISSINLLSQKELVNKNILSGGLIIAGSYVEKTTQQLLHLQPQFKGLIIELNVDEIIRLSIHSKDIAEQMNTHLKNGINVLIYTSRTLAVSSIEQTNLTVNQQVANFITAVVANLSVQPKWLIAKGGITSSDIAVKSLQIKRAIVMGQVLAGIPVWQAGNESKFPNLNYIIFPGNVGSNNALLELYNKLNNSN